MRRGDIDDFLARTIEKLNNFEESRLTTLENEFLASMEHNYQLFGPPLISEVSYKRPGVGTAVRSQYRAF